MKRRAPILNTIGLGKETAGAGQHGKATVTVSGGGRGRYKAERLHRVPRVSQPLTPLAIAVSHLYAVAAPGTPPIPRDQIAALRRRFAGITLDRVAHRKIASLLTQADAATVTQLANSHIPIVADMARKRI